MADICANENIPIFIHNESDEEPSSKSDTLYDIQTKVSNEFLKNKSTFSKSEDNIKNSITVSQDENDYSNQKCSLGSDFYVKQKSTLSRKREAGNILMECVKRRDNLRNIDYASNVPFAWKLINNCNILPDSDISACKYQTENNINLLDIDSKSLIANSLITASPVNQIVNQSNDVSKSSSTQSTDEKQCSYDGKDLMEIDVLAEVPSMQNSLKQESLKLPVISSSVPSQSKAVSVGIHKDLNSLHLTDQTIITDPLDKAQLSISTIKPPVIPSLFKGVSSAIYFATREEKVIPMPSEVRQLMRWKLSTITPVLIREMVSKSGFDLVTGEPGEQWIGTWGKHMKCATFKQVKSFQKVNHFPGSFHLGRKDKLWDNYRRMQQRHGSNAFYFFPDTYILPADMKTLKQTWEHDSFDKFWIIKPPASARGTGIKVIHKWSQVPKNRPVIVQRYISDPYLINGTKFDLRVYVLVPSIEPLRIYIFDDGLVRFASEKYTLSSQTFSNRFMHLTNYSINRKSSSYTANEDGNACHGHKWTLKSFWTYMSNNNIDVEKIKESITDMIIKTILCAEGPICRLMKTYAKSTYNCFELFGFDIMLDKNLRPWLLEVNISPSLHTRSMLDSSVKSQLVKDMFNIVCYQVPEVKRHFNLDSCDTDYGISSPVAHKHKALRNRYLSVEERNKHSIFTFEHTDEKCDILENLTPDDVRCLIESEDEYNRKGSFTKVFPSQTSSKYFVYFEHIRYYNILLEAWEKRFSKDKTNGISLLQNMCEKKFHLQTSSRTYSMKQSNISDLNNSVEAKS